MIPAVNIQRSQLPRIYNETPSGAVDCVNLTYVAAKRFDPDSLIVRIDGIVLDPEQYTVLPDNQSFTLVIDPSDINALSCPPSDSEKVKIDYNSQEPSCINLL